MRAIAVSRLCIAAMAVLPAVSGLCMSDSGAKLMGVRRIWSEAEHCAFTDLARFNGRWYCTFRESDKHVYGRDGVIRVITSANGENWESAALLSEEGVDLRDPKLSVTPDGRLMLLMGGSVYKGRELLGRQCRVSFSRDGKEWTVGRKVLSDGQWLWRVTWHEGKAYGVAYAAADGEEWGLRLYESPDGVEYTEATVLEVGSRPNETTLRFLPDGRMMALVRREADGAGAMIGTSKQPFKDWQWRETGHRVGGPDFVVLPDGATWAGCRSYTGGAKTVLARLSQDEYEPVLTLPSGGDTSYPGMVWHDGLLWMSYYSSHEDKTSIYLAKINIGE